MDPSSLNTVLHQEADFLIQEIGLPRLLEPHGGFTLAGSYYLDTMVYPDLDLYFPRVSIAQIFKIGGQIARSGLVTQVVFEKSEDLSMPDGLYLKPRMRYGDWGRLWKFDMWSLEEELIQKRMAVMGHFKERMTEEVRLAILQYKLSIMTREGRTPMYSGFYIYRAFIEEGMEDFGEVSEYLRKKGVVIEE